MRAVKDETVKIPESECGKLLELARLVEVIVAENARLSAENKLLRDKVDLLVRRVFGSSSEKLDINQMTLDIGAEETVKLDVAPMSFRKVVTVRPKFIRRESGQAPVI